MEKLTVRPGQLEKLAQLAEKPAAGVHLVAHEYDHVGLERLASALTKYGAALGVLDFSLGFPHHPYNHDLRDLDFAATCPHLQSLAIGRCHVNASILRHPALVQITLDHCWLYTPDPLCLGYPDAPLSRLAELTLQEVNWGNRDQGHLGALAFGPDAALRSFSYYLDEDNSEIYPERITFDGCPHLTQVSVHVCGAWSVAFKGNLPKLSGMALSSQRYGDHRICLDEIGDGSSAYALRFRDKQGPFAGQHFLFVGAFRYLDLDKAQHVITQLGGHIVQDPSDTLTWAVLNDEEYAAYEAGTPLPRVARLVALQEQGAAFEIVDDIAFREIMYGWY